jgi:hypothetical protein
MYRSDFVLPVSAITDGFARCLDRISDDLVLDVMTRP